jgi:hypothetical protein
MCFPILVSGHAVLTHVPSKELALGPAFVADEPAVGPSGELPVDAVTVDWEEPEDEDDFRIS